MKPLRPHAFIGLAIGLMLKVTPAVGHQQWANGSAVPAWVKESCCGPADAHHLNVEDVSFDGKEYHVRGYPWPIPAEKALSSQDGDYWLFYSTYYNYSDSKPQFGFPICFFVPLGA